MSNHRHYQTSIPQPILQEFSQLCLLHVCLADALILYQLIAHAEGKELQSHQLQFGGQLLKGVVDHPD